MKMEKRKCSKCGQISSQDTTITFHRFPAVTKPNSFLRARVWAYYCFPEKDWSLNKSLINLSKQHKMLCSKHFDSTAFTDKNHLHLNCYSIPKDAKNIMEKLRNAAQDMPQNAIMKKVKLKVKEIQIPTSWGHISGKLWGNNDQRPILALHGWQDNAATWDTLIPLLPKHYSILAIDFPGHGNSSWFPKGMHYYPWDWPRTIQAVKDHFNWDKISFLSHSMGSIASMRYAVLYPDVVDLYIAFEHLVMDQINQKSLFKKLPDRINKLDIEQGRLDKEPPSYPYDEAIKILHEGTGKSVSLKSAPYLIDRGTKPSKKNPNHVYFCRDSRLKHILFVPEDKDLLKMFAANLKTPTLYFKATDSDYASDEFSVEIRDFLIKNNSLFKCHFLPGTHHVHLNNPESVAPLIIDFLAKHYKE